jgi:hypothetical protein
VVGRLEDDGAPDEFLELADSEFTLLPVRHGGTIVHVAARLFARFRVAVLDVVAEALHQQVGELDLHSVVGVFGEPHPPGVDRCHFIPPVSRPSGLRRLRAQFTSHRWSCFMASSS